MNNILVLDVENTIHVKSYYNRDMCKSTITKMGPFHPNNKLVSVGIGINPDDVNDTEYYCFNHNEKSMDEGAFEAVQKHLDKADLLIGHNLKHDMHWLRACGFEYTGKLWDTQIAEFVLCRSIKRPLALKHVAKRYEAPAKRTDIIDEYMKDGIMFDTIPWDIVEEYGRGDITTTMAVYLTQQKLFKMSSNVGLLPTVRMMCDFLHAIEEMEFNGLSIDFDALNEVEKEYLKEHAELELRLTELASDVMGDTPIRLGSNDFLSELLYSRRVKDKNQWKQLFNIGTDAMGKKLRRPNMSKSKFNQVVRSQTDVIRRTEVKHCHTCAGKGTIFKVKKDGTPWKKMPKCPDCGGAGIIYKDTGRVGGFKLVPKGIAWASASGFSASKDVIEGLSSNAPENAKEFLSKMVRFNAIKTYLSTFVDGINKHCGEDGILHPSLNQTVTATARLSSSGPNYQNQPRGNTFPVRKVVVSRFKNGTILEFDYAQLEFRIAGFLSGDLALRKFVEDGNDAHAFSRDTINEFDPDLPSIDRQEAKPHTFKPLYGGMSGTPREKHYYKMFLEKFPDVAKWHEVLKQNALKYKKIVLPSGREYAFPYVKRLGTGYVQGTTQIVNYPVQGFATADITPLGIIRVLDLMRENDVKSLLILTVHDSVIVDVYPGEEELMSKIMSKGLLDIANMCKRYYGIEFDFPLEVEGKAGPNWLEMKEVGVYSNA